MSDINFAGEFVLNVGRPMTDAGSIGLIETLWLPGPWHCRQWCLESKDSMCNSYLWIPDIALGGISIDNLL